MKNKISSLISSGFLVLVFFLVLLVLSQCQEQPLMTRIDHFYVESGQARSLFTFFKDTLQLPESWPFRDAGTHTSGGLWVGNTILEFVTFPHNSDTIVRTGFRGIAFETAGGADETASELTKRNIPHTDVENRMGKGSDGQMRVNRSLLYLNDLPPAESDIFFIDYKFRKAVAARHEAINDKLESDKGGPLGIIGVAEITIGVRDIDEARSKWSALLAPAPQISEDVFAFDSGPRIRLVRSESPGIQGIILSVRSLDEAEKFLKESQLLVKDVGQIAIAPQAVEGLSIRLAGADQDRKPAHPLLGPGQGTGQGVDHVGIAVRDIKKTRYDYEQVLGFKVIEATQPNGWPQAGILFEDLTFLEFQPIVALSWIAKKFDYADGYADFAEKNEGAVFLGLATSSAKDAADYLKARNFQTYLNVEEAPGFYDLVEISHDPSGEKQAFPLAIFLVEYFFDPGRPARFAARREQGIMTHPNTARRLHSVWFAVHDVVASLRSLKDTGLEPGQAREAKFLGATGREVQAGNGYLLLMQPADKSSALNAFLSDRHDGEIIGVSIEVTDLNTARSWIEGHSGRKPEPYDGFYGRSILIPPELTHGIWMELFQQ